MASKAATELKKTQARLQTEEPRRTPPALSHVEGTALSPVEALVERNLPLVKYVLGKVARNLPPHVDRDDLLAAGALGLTESARRYDPSRNVPFHSYAVPRIWGAMLDELRRHDWLSPDMRGQVKRLKRTLDDARQRGGVGPTNEELAANLGCVPAHLTRLLALAKADRHTGEGDTLNAEVGLLSAELGIPAPRNPYEEVEFSDQKRVLAEAIKALPEREGQVIILRYHENLMLHEIGKVLDVTASRACQLHAQALERLKRALSRVGLDTMDDGR